MKRTRGFTLIELAIVLVIVTILIGGLAMPLSAQIQARRIGETRADMQAIHDALIGYAMSHYITTPTPPCTCNYDSGGDFDPSALGSCEKTLCPAGSTPNTSFPPFKRHYLPCPDAPNDGNAVTTNDDDGIEEPRVSGECTLLRGGLPWVTLGVKGQDAWGNRYTYAVTKEFSKGFTSSSPGDLNIYPDFSCTTASVAEKVPAVVVSHGPNSRGARNINLKSDSPTPAPPSLTTKDELQNLNRQASLLPCLDDTKFVSTTPTDTFDDLVIWLSNHKLFSRICPDGGCP
ncbi:MAG: type II secretion system protein [Thiobacillus sp.]|nr:type II secretion system protein [Thiobacillus sp.]